MRRSNAIVGTLLLLVLAATPGWTQKAHPSLGRGKEVSGKEPRLLDRRAGLSVQNVPLEEALLELTRSSGVPLAFSPARIPANVRASCTCGDVTVREALDRLLSETPLEYSELAGQIVLFSASPAAAARESNALALFALRTVASELARGMQSLLPTVVQDTVIAGVVVNARTGEPVQGAQVIVEGTGRAAVTDGAGRFRIGVARRGDVQLRVTMLGYRTLVRQARVGDLGVRVALEETAIELDQLVVTGTPFETRRRTVPNPINVITAEQIEQKQVTNITDLLRGEIPGVFALSGGQADYFTTIYARGDGSWQADDVMKIYVDGVEVADASYITTIDPRSIERIEVVRGPQASVIYGSEASSGVLQIFTKRGGDGLRRPVLDVQASVGVVESDLKPSDGGTPLTHEYSLALSGGTRETFSYRASASYTSLGEWVTGYDSKMTSLTGAMRAVEGPFVIELTTRWSDRALHNASQPIFWRYPQSSRCTYCGQRDLVYPNYERALGQNTTGLTLSYSATPKWQHNLILGQDQNRNAYHQPEPHRLTPADTFVVLFHNEYRRRSIRYNTALEAALASRITARFTAGVDYWMYDIRGSTGSRLRKAYGDVQTSSSTSASFRNDRWWSAGVFGMAEIGFRDRLHLTLAARVQEMPNLGEEYGRPLQPRAGLAYVREVGPVDVKLRGQLGKGVRMPPEFARPGGQLGQYFYLPNPNIGPEEKVGWDAGLELYWGRTASFAVTRYEEEGRNLINAVTINPDTTPVIRQWQNIGVVGIEGWEIEGSVNVGPLSLRANYAYSDNRIRELSDEYTANPNSTISVGDRRFFVPTHSAGGTLTARFWRGNASVNWSAMAGYRALDYLAYYDYLYGGAPYRGSQKAYQTEYPATWKWNFRMQQNLGKGFTVFFRIDNLTNNQEADFHNVNVDRGRTTVLGARFRY